MTEWTLSADVRRLLGRSPLYTVAHVEILLALRRAAPAPRTPGELATEADLPAGPVVRRCVADLVRAGLVAPLADRDAYRYAPSKPTLDAQVDALAEARREHPTHLVRALYSRLALR